MKPIQITVARETSGWGKPWYAYSEQLGGIDYDWNGDGWNNCGSPRGEGKTIQEALTDFLEQVEEDRAGKADPNDENFIYEMDYRWV